jgi:tripartite-type tricarboxylate transporter receptor subunit TctC
MVKAGTPKDIIDTLTSTIEKMKLAKEWQDFSRLNMQSPVSISLDDMQKKVREEITADRAFLQSTEIRK